MGDIFLRTYQWIASKKWIALTGFLLLLAVLATIIRQIQFDDDISALIPVNEETQRVQKLLKSITFTDKIIVNIRKGKEGSTEDLTTYASEFLDSLNASQGEFIKNIQGKVEDNIIQSSFDLVNQNLPLFLDAEDYQTIEAKLATDSIAKITEANYRTLISPAGIVAKKNIVKDPLGLSFIGLKKLQKLGFGEGFKVKNGFLVDANEESILLFITPTFGSNETNKNAPFAEALYQLQEHLNSKYSKKIQVEYFGAALSAVSNAKQIKHDIQFTVSIAMTLLILLLIIFYRKWTLPFILFAPAFFGGLLAIAILVLIREDISAISLGIGSVLLGVTLDYGLHILTHLREGNTVTSVYKEVAPAVLMSSLTTASAFLCLLFLSSQALQDLGVFAAVSVLGASVFALLFIPLAYKPQKAIISKTTVLDRLAAHPLHRNKWAIIMLFIITVVSVFTYQRVQFNKDIAKLNYETKALIEARERLEKLTDMGSKSIYLATYGDNFQKVLEQNDHIFNQLDELKAENKVLNFGSISSLVKSNKIQNEKTNAWQQFWSPERIKNLTDNLVESGNKLGFKETTFNQFYSFLKKDFGNLSIEEVKSIKAFPVEDYLVKEGETTTVTSLAKINTEYLTEVRQKFSNMENTLLIDRQQVNESFLGSLKDDFNELLSYSLIAVILILFLFYRRLVLTLITAIPIFLTWFLTVGIMGLLGLEFNIFNIIICSFIFGLGVDYSIFITNGLLTEYRTGERALSTHKTSIILSVITTIAGVGVLIFAKHPVLYTISSVSLIGIFCAAFTAFIVQPLLFQLFIGNRNKRPITPRVLIHSLLSFAYFDLGGLFLSLYSWGYLKLNPKAAKNKNMGLHRLTSSFMKSVLYTNPFVKKKLIHLEREKFDQPALLIANHSSFLDILVMGMLHPKTIYLVKDHVYNSKIIGSAARLSGAYPVSGGIDGGEAHLREKLKQGFSIIAFPEGSRSNSNKIGRFHKGAFYLAEKLNLDIVPVMIHGASEVSPKGSFVIRDGSITAKYLDRISPKDLRFGETYTQRAKQVGAYFRSEFRAWRKELESPVYWHKTILENFRYKGDALFKYVREDLKKRQSAYHQLIYELEEKDQTMYITDRNIHLPLLLSLDSIDRKFFAYIEHEHERSILAHHYLTHRYSKITVEDNLESTLENRGTTIIVEKERFALSNFPKELLSNIETIVQFSQERTHQVPLGFKVLLQNDTFIMLKKDIQ
ncbi:1-acyl-sn-glycerol-3-phosphate acyltransferase [Euzebyella saccharophila]|uniref:1-acyl-sn-glycerol-3-phosphate acyltransferase n=1 Tax=Euzebyella saccharophila TaxID=679664 RepID=A0ABV8JMJ0_9FLAO|nr:1-acyl-sn-glycerol-3-phosphate acyltransferase [Euzebyella saccharophila]